MDFGLQGKHAIVTGGSRGIGKAICTGIGSRRGRCGDRGAEQGGSGGDGAGAGRRDEPAHRSGCSRCHQQGTSGPHGRRGGTATGRPAHPGYSGSAPGGSTTATGPIETVIDEDLIQDFNTKYVGALRCSRAVIPFMKTAGWGRIINISGGNARNAGNLSGGARNAGLVHMTKTLAVQLGRHGITVNCIHPGTTRTERTPSLLAARANQLGVSPEEAERRDFAPDSPRGNAICRMVDASEVAFVAVFLASEKAWAVSGELVSASGGAGRAVYY